jgi:long-chain fatty acid transport protein
MSKKIIITLTLFIMIPFWSKAGGYQVNLVGIRYIGMGHIGTSLSMDAGCIFFNPGNLGFLKSKVSITGGVSGIWSYTAFRNESPSLTQAKTNNPVAPPFTLFASYKLNEKLSAGIGVYTPFGSSVRWQDNWTGRYLIQNISLKTVLVQPTLSYKITDKIGIGAGLVFAYGNVNLKKGVPVSDTSGQEGQAHLKGHATNWGFNAGIAFHPTEKLSIGLSYRSKINMNVKNGSADFSVPTSLSSSFPANNTFNASVPLPANLNLGVSYQISDKLLVGVDVNFVKWNVYDSLIFDFKTNTSSLSDSRNPKEYKNSFIFRAGGQYEISKKLIARAGGYFDNTPTRSQYFSPETPDANRIGFSAGLSWKPAERLSIDLSFLFVNELKRTAIYQPANFGGTYKSYAYVPGIGLTYNF